MTLVDLNGLSREDACVELRRCCGSRKWAERMAAARPLASLAALHHTAERMWWQLAPEDWLEAFRAHPKIGERTGTAGWAAQEQAGVNSATGAMEVELEQSNQEYLARFGYIFIVCATGKTAQEMLEILRSRLSNGADEELRTAATEQSQITRIRLDKLVTS